jgi:type I restriction enzyme, S subunit
MAAADVQLGAGRSGQSGGDPVTIVTAAPPTWGVAKASMLAHGERRMEAETYLADGYGLRTSIEARDAGWVPLGTLAHVWQPSRLKGIVVDPAYGVPFLATGQVFEARPTPRKWLSLAQIPDASNRFLEHGTVLVSRSGNVGRVTIAHHPHLRRIVSDDLLRVNPSDQALTGWLYAYLRTPQFRMIATAERYGHVVKHLEVSHLNALPVVMTDKATSDRFQAEVARVFRMRDQSHAFIAKAESAYAAAVGLREVPDAEAPFSVRASSLIGGRRRLDAFHHNISAASIEQAYRANARRVDTLGGLSEDIWWPNRFSRVFGDNGTPYVSAEDLFNLNPVITKRVYAGLVANRDDYFLDPDWLVLVRSGQVYGLNGSVRLVGSRLTKFFVSEDLIRISPRTDLIRPGYLLCALSHPVLGRPMVIKHAYGTSIPHLEPQDVGLIPIPRFSRQIEGDIADQIEGAVQLQAEADDLEDQLTADAEHIATMFIRGTEPR